MLKAYILSIIVNDKRVIFKSSDDNIAVEANKAVQKGTFLMFVVPNTSGMTTNRSLTFAERVEGRSPSFVPMVYERVDDTPSHWEYHVLRVDTREQELPDAVTLNELGSKGWILTGVVPQPDSTHVFFYFVRQSA